MNKEQILLLKIAEEAAELAQICSKSIKFGLYNHKPGEDITNLERLKSEFLDLLSAIHYLEINNNINLDPGKSEVDMERLKRTDKYLQVSRDLGILI